MVRRKKHYFKAGKSSIEQCIVEYNICALVFANTQTWDTIIYHSGSFGFGGHYDIDDYEVDYSSSDFRIDGVYGDDRLFEMNPVLGILDSHDVKTGIDALYKARSDVYTFTHNMMDITNEDIMDALEMME